MRGYSRRLDFLELNPIVDLRRDNEVDYSSHIITKKNRQFEFLRMKLTQ